VTLAASPAAAYKGFPPLTYLEISFFPPALTTLLLTPYPHCDLLDQGLLTSTHSISNPLELLPNLLTYPTSFTVIMASVGTTPPAAPRSMSEEQSPSAIKSAMSLHAILAPTDEYAVKANSIEVDAFLDATAGKTADADHGVVDKTEDDEDMEIDDDDEDADMDDVDEDDANRTREFICLADEFSECMTGQYKLKLSRKVRSLLIAHTLVPNKSLR
jgi:hypothetical protein